MRIKKTMNDDVHNKMCIIRVNNDVLREQGELVVYEV